jgi:uncharacterized membrane protein YfcA
VVLTLQFALGIYGGYFGGAIGIMMMALWGLLDSRDVKSLNAPRTLLVTAANAMAVLIFIGAQAVRWRETLVLLVAATIGGYCGAVAEFARIVTPGYLRGSRRVADATCAA